LSNNSNQTQPTPTVPTQDIPPSKTHIYTATPPSNLSPTVTPSYFTASTSVTIPSISSTGTITYTATPTATPNLTHTPVIVFTKTPSPTPSSTFVPILPIDLTILPINSLTPIPIKGITIENLPRGFKVGTWHDDHIECDSNPKHHSVRLYSVEISGGIPPFEITFWKPNGNFIFRITPFKEKLNLFDQDITIEKGQYIYVTITFKLRDGSQSFWSDHLYYYYLNDPDCSDP